jgi:hypothetical protein
MMELLALVLIVLGVGALLVVAPRPPLAVMGLLLKICGIVLLGGIALAFGWLGTHQDDDVLG